MEVEINQYKLKYCKSIGRGVYACINIILYLISSTALHRCVTFHRDFRIVEIVTIKALHNVDSFVLGFGIILIVSTKHGSIRRYGGFPIIL